MSVPAATVAETPMSFDQLPLSQPMRDAIAAAGFTAPTPIQAGTIPPLLEGRDVLGQAQTGTGKTAAFAIPFSERIDASKKETQLLVLTPTRELAMQVAESFKKFSTEDKRLRVAAIFGGSSYQTQLRQLQQGVHIVVGTPGRVIDLIKRQALKLDQLRGLVLDEADEMLQMGFADDVDWVLAQSPAGRQIALFSATMPGPIRAIAQRHLKDPVEVIIQQRTATAETIRQRYLVVLPSQKQRALARILEAESTDGVLIFVKNKSTTEPLAQYLANQGHRTAALSSDVAQNQRGRIMDNLREGVIDIVVATDVAARGLDVERISHVINFDLPSASESYVHRIGRTGRAGRSGEAILFFHPREQHLLRRLEKATRQTIGPMELPSRRVINQCRVGRFHEKISKYMEHEQFGTMASIVEQYRTMHNVPIEQIAAALAVMATGPTPLLLSEELPTAEFSSGHATREPRSASPGRQRSGPRSDAQMNSYRIGVGRKHQINPGNIVGAITAELGVNSSTIGRIEIFEDFSTVDLHNDLSEEHLQTLKKIRVGGRPMGLRPYNSATPASSKPFRKKPFAKRRRAAAQA